MKNSMNSSAQQPMIVKYVETLHTGIQSQSLSRYAIGYILRGTMYVYDGDKRRKFTRGDIFYLGIGHHYIEHFPENGQPFEQILVYYTPSDLQRILLHLNITYGLNISNSHSCENCNNRMHVVMPAWSAVRNFFSNINSYLRDEDFHHDETAENIKMTELIYLIASHEDCCIKSKLLSNVDAAKENFEQIVYDHIFKAHIVQEGVPPPFPDAAPQVVHPPTSHALAVAADFDFEVGFRNRQRMHVPQHVAFHQVVQERVPDDARNLSQPAPQHAFRATGDRTRKRSHAGSPLMKNL